MQRHILTLSLTLTALTIAPAADAEWVLPPEAASSVKRAVQVQSKPDKAGAIRSAALDKTTILVTAERKGVVAMTVTLVHPSVAPEDAFRGAGVALLTTPGPVDDALLAALKASLTAAKRPVPWVQTEDDPADTVDEAEVAADKALVRARSLMDGGAEPAQVRAALASLPEALAPALAVRAGVLWQRLGDAKAARAALAGLASGETPSHAAAAAILGAPVDPEATLGKAKGSDACALIEVANAVATLGRGDEALALAEAIRARVMDCAAAWESALHRHVEGGDQAAAVALAEQALARFGTKKETPVGLLSTIGSLYLAAGRDAEAVDLFEVVASRDPADERAVRLLLSALLRDPEARAAHTERLATRHAAEPDNRLVQLLLGVVQHYANEFEASNAMLVPLEATMGHQSRLHIYLALNDLNLENDAAALKRLTALAERDNPDPDAFYYRAEVLRDTEREAARADLVRYQTMVRASGVSNPSQEARVKRLVAALDECLKTSARRCRSEWENPRILLDSSTRSDKAPAGVDPMAPPIDVPEDDGPAVGEAGRPTHVTKLVINVATNPDDYGGNVFLMGYWDLDVGGRPMEGSQPAQFRQLGMWVQHFPLRTKVRLTEGLYYRVLYSHNDYPLPHDAACDVFQVGSTPSNEIVLFVDRYASRRGEGRPPESPMQDQPTKLGGPTAATNVAFHMEPPPANTGGKIFLAGFRNVNADTGMPGRNELPSDYHVIEGVAEGLPLRRAVRLVSGLHYLAMYGMGEFPGEGDRLSLTATYDGQADVAFTIRDQFAGGDPSAGSPPTGEAAEEAEQDEDRRWFALLIGLFVAMGVFWFVRRRA
jgi:tetratricopeptide (TPR) repeat protein